MSKILWGQLISVFGIVWLGIWGATQWTAAALGYQAELGHPWARLFGHPLFPTFKFFWWWFFYDAYAPHIFLHGATIIVASVGLAILASITLSVWRARAVKNAETFGSARWATTSDVRDANLLGEDGIILGKWKRRHLRHNGPEHVLCFAPTRSGKGVGLVIPTLLAWAGSCIIHDIKGENWDLTAGFRNCFGRVLRFDPTNKASHAYNPLMEIRRGDLEVRDAQNLAEILVDPNGSLEIKNHWAITAQSLLVGVILHVLYAETDKTLSGVANFISNPNCPLDTVITTMLTTPHLGEGSVHPVVASAARELRNKSDNERSGVVSTAMGYLTLYRDPVIAHVTRQSEWRISDILDSAEPVSLYLVVPPSDIDRTRPLMRLIFNQITRQLTEEFQSEHSAVTDRPHKLKQRVLLMLDEFPALGRLKFFESALAFMAGYGIKAFLIAQSLNQIVDAYGNNSSILDNCHIKVSFGVNDDTTAERISKMLGTATQTRASKNYAGSRFAPILGHVMESSSETARPLLTPTEVRELRKDKEIVFASATAPILAKRALYHADRRLRARVLPPPEFVPLAKEDLPANDWHGLAPIAPVAPPDATKGQKPVARGKAKGARQGGNAQDGKPQGGAAHSGTTQDGTIGLERDLGKPNDIVATPMMTPEFFNDPQTTDDGAAEQEQQRLKKLRSLGNDRDNDLDM